LVVNRHVLFAVVRLEQRLPDITLEST